MLHERLGVLYGLGVVSMPNLKYFFLIGVEMAYFQSGSQKQQH
jgi:hypothetical protein